MQLLTSGKISGKKVLNSLGILQNPVELFRPKLDISKISHNFIEKQEIKVLDTSFKGLPENKDHFMLELEPLHFFNDLEKEYNKVKDFDFKNINVTDITYYIKKI